MKDTEINAKIISAWKEKVKEEIACPAKENFAFAINTIEIWPNG